MSIATQITRPPKALSKSRRFGIPPFPIMPFSVDQYHSMIDEGIVNSRDRVELLNGWVVKKMPINPPRAVASKKSRKALERAVPRGWDVDAVRPVTLVETESEPEPDITVFRGKSEAYLDRHPGPEDIGVLVEISAASLKRDRGLKMEIYARVSIAFYWIINLRSRKVEVYSNPTGETDSPRYRDRRDYGEKEAVPLILDGREIARIPVRDLLP